MAQSQTEKMTEREARTRAVWDWYRQLPNEESDRIDDQCEELARSLGIPDHTAWALLIAAAYVAADSEELVQAAQEVCQILRRIEKLDYGAPDFDAVRRRLINKANAALARALKGH